MTTNKRQRAAVLKKRDRYILLLERERRRLYRAQWNAPLIELEKHRQQGWFRELRLTADALCRKDAPDSIRMLDAMNRRQFSWCREFMHQIGCSKKWVPMKFYLRSNYFEGRFSYLLVDRELSDFLKWEEVEDEN